MSWHIGPPRETLTLVGHLTEIWHETLFEEVAESKARWRLDAYLSAVNSPVTIADTFIDEWLEGLWRNPLK